MIRALSRQHPQTVAALILLAFVLVITLPYLLWGGVDVTNGTGIVGFEGLTSGIFWQAVLTGVLLIVVWILGWFDIVSLKGPVDRKGVAWSYWIGAYPMIGLIGFGVTVLTQDNMDNPLQIIGIVLLLNLFVGLSEELLFRGFIFGALRQRHTLFTAIWASSLAFGMLHLTNLAIGQALPLTLFQVVNAAALGVLFCAVCLQANSIWPAVILHMIWNSFVMLGQAVSESSSDPALQATAQSADLGLQSLILPLILILLATWILHHYARRTGQNLWQRPTNPAVCPVSA